MTINVGLPEFIHGSKHPYLNPEVLVQAQGQAVGWVGKIHDDLADFYLARHETWYADLDLDLLMQMRNKIVFRSLPRFPVVRRDMTLVAPQDLAISTIIGTVHAIHEPLLEDVYLVNMYTPEGSVERNLSFRFVFRHLDKTLKDKEVEKVISRLSQYLLKHLPVHFS